MKLRHSSSQHITTAYYDTTNITASTYDGTKQYEIVKPCELGARLTILRYERITCYEPLTKPQDLTDAVE